LKQALRLAMNARDRDELIDCILRFARQFAGTVVLFVVGRREILGWDAVGIESGTGVRNLKLPLGANSILTTALENRAPYLGEIVDSVGNRTLLNGMGKREPSNAFVIPLIVRNRVVALLYGDDGERPVRSAQLSPLLVFASRLSGAFERLILRMKRQISRLDRAEAIHGDVRGLADASAIRGLGLEGSTPDPPV